MRIGNKGGSEDREGAVERAYEVHGAIHCISIADGRMRRLSDGVTVALLSLRIKYNVPDVAKLFSRFGPLAHAPTPQLLRSVTTIEAYKGPTGGDLVITCSVPHSQYRPSL